MITFEKSNDLYSIILINKIKTAFKIKINFQLMRTFKNV
jgi:hypothetical protein